MRLVVLFGGRSAEHEISCVSATHVAAAAGAGRYEVVLVGVTPKGQWVAPNSFEGPLVASGAPVDADAVLAGADVVFPVLHGPFGEDGTIQGLLELADVPYVGTGVLGSALCMDKAMTKAVLRAAGLPQVRYVVARDAAFDDAALDESVLERVADELGFPLFVKPANLGSSIGVSRADDDLALIRAVEMARVYDEWLVFEEAVEAREIECGVLGYPTVRPSVPGEVSPSREVYDFDDKYTLGIADLLVPAPLHPAIAAAVKNLAVLAATALRVEGMARVDFLYEERGRGLLVNEINTIPGFTPISMYPRLWAASGLAATELVDELVDAALARHAHRGGRVGRPR
ncbi:MAG: D-alanine--D-alanine ligase family protein [Acidimicrobiales bacterium]